MWVMVLIGKVSSVTALIYMYEIMLSSGKTRRGWAHTSNGSDKGNWGNKGSGLRFGDQWDSGLEC